jgi:hypothetical protein
MAAGLGLTLLRIGTRSTERAIIRSKVLDAANFMRAESTGNRGTILNVEMDLNQNPAMTNLTNDTNMIREMAGVAKDTKGNICELVFR